MFGNKAMNVKYFCYTISKLKKYLNAGCITGVYQIFTDLIRFYVKPSKPIGNLNSTVEA